MAPECTVCGAPTRVSDACPHCAAACCPAHRPPAAHDCPGTDAGATGGWRLDLDGADGTAGGPAEEPSLWGLLRPGVGLALLAVVLVGAALGAVAYAGSLDGGFAAGSVEERVVERTTEQRHAAGVGAATHDAVLAAVARAHSRDMRDRGFVNHTNPDGEGPGDRVRAAGLECRPGENVYQAPRGALADSGRALADHVVREWIDSPGHRETLLRERYARQGVGVAVGEEAVFVTQMFC